MTHQLSVGILLGVASAAAANVGVVIEKRAMRRMPPLDARRGSEMLRRLIGNPMWLAGFSLVAFGLVLQVVALSVASISVVQAVAPTGTALLLVLSHIFLGDRLRRAEYFGIAALVVALGLLALSLDSHSDQATGSASLSALLAVTIPTVGVSVMCFLVASRVQGPAVHRRKWKAPLYGLATGLLYGCAALDMKSISTFMQRSGTVQAVPQIVASPVFYLFLATSFLVFLMFQTALQRSTTSVFVPVSSVLNTAYFIVVGDALFHEHLPRAPASLSLRLASFAMLAVGLLTLTVANEAHDPEEQREVVAAPASFREGLEHASPRKRRQPQLSRSALSVGLSWPLRARLAVFSLVAVGTILVAVLPFPEGTPWEVVVACVMVIGLAGSAALVPWERLPDWAWLVLPLGYVAVVALVRDVQGGGGSGLEVLFLLPILWLALSGRRLHLFVGLFCVSLALLVPILTVESPKYPMLDWRQVATIVTVTTLVAWIGFTFASRDRTLVDELVSQSGIAERNESNARVAEVASANLLSAASGAAMIGVDQSGSVTFFSAGAEEMFGYAATEIVGSRSISDLLERGRIDEDRHSSDSLRSVFAIL